MVRCNACTNVDKFPALAAFDAPVRCKCGETMNVRDELMAAIRQRPDRWATAQHVLGPLALA